MKRLELIGKKFCRLTVMGFDRISKHGHTMWRCRCACGKETIVMSGDLTSGKSKSCGCLKKERAHEINTTHGMCGTPEYTAWQGMLKRCYNPNNTSYKNYGGRGISVHERWLRFENFYDDIGPKPSPDHSLDRIDNDGNYEPSNIRWATRTEQNRNQRIRSDNKMGVCGVCPMNGKYWAYISVNHKRKHLGYFTKLKEAVAVRKEAEILYWE